jgi:hypothetical protein
MPLRTQQLSGRHPFEIFMLALTLVTGAPVLLGVTPRPGSMNALVSSTYVHIWAGALVIGASLALIGVAWKRPKDPRLMSVTGLSLEQVGLVMVAAATLFYTAVLLLSDTPGAGVAIGTILAYGSSCAVRAWQLQGIIRGTRLMHHDR